jgi:hypothetical protein
MDKNLTRIFCNLQVTPRDHLAADICHVIVLREKRSRHIKLSGYSIIAVVSLAAIIPATISLVDQFGQSGFTQYASLAISDGNVLAGYWKQFAVTLVESIPGISLSIVLGTVLVLGWSSRNAIRQAQSLSFVTERHI